MVWGNGAALSIPPVTGACLWMEGWFAPAPGHKGDEEGVSIIPPPCTPLAQGSTTHPAQPGLRAEAVAICLTFLAAHPNLKVTASPCTRY